MTEEESHLVAQERGGDGDEDQSGHRQVQLIPQDRCRHQQGIAGQKREQDAGFDKDDEGDARQDPGAKRGQDGLCIEDVGDRVHGSQLFHPAAPSPRTAAGQVAVRWLGSRALRVCRDGVGSIDERGCPLIDGRAPEVLRRTRQ